MFNTEQLTCLGNAKITLYLKTMPTLLSSTLPPQYIGDATVVLPIYRLTFQLHLRFTVFGELLEYHCPELEMPEAALRLTFGKAGMQVINAEINFLPYRLTFMAYMPILGKYLPNPWQPIMQQLLWLRGGSVPKYLPYPKCQPFTQLFARWLKPARKQYEMELVNAIIGNNIGVLKNKYYPEWLSMPVWVYFLQASKMPYLRSTAAYYLKHIKNTSAVLPVLASALYDENREVRQYVLETLKIIGNHSVAPFVIDALNDPFYWLRVAATEVLAKIADSRAIEPLLHLLKDDYYKVRRAAVTALGAFADARIVEPLIQVLLNDHNMEVRQVAAKTLGIIGDTRAIEPLKQITTHDNEQLRAYALTALGSFNHPDSAELFIDALNSTHKHTRRAAADNIKKMGAAAVAPLIMALNHPAILTRHYAILLLSDLNDTRAIPHLQHRLQVEQHPLCKEALHEAIQKLQSS